MSYRFSILKAAVEQQVLFMNEEDYEKYMLKLEEGRHRFQVISKTMNEDGTVTLVIRKSYNNSPFLPLNNENE